jgi:hypothetical protein
VLNKLRDNEKSESFEISGAYRPYILDFRISKKNLKDTEICLNQYMCREEVVVDIPGQPSIATFQKFRHLNNKYNQLEFQNI